MFDFFRHLVRAHNLHRNETGQWMFKSRDGVWHTFNDDAHFANTVRAGYDVQFFAPVPMELPEEVA